MLNKETGNTWSESAYRKPITSYIDGWDDCLINGVTDEEALEQIESKMDELYKQRIKTSDKVRELRKHLRDEARVENLKDVFIEVANIIAKENPVGIFVSQPENKHYNRIAILQLSDLHFDEIVNNFLNTYNHEVFDNRMAKLTQDVIRYCQAESVNTLKVLNQGDLVNGNIHVSSRVMSEEDVVYQTQYVSETLAKMLIEFGKAVPNVEFHSVVDNHSRINKNKKEHIEKESFSRFIPWYLEARLVGVNNVKIVKNMINGFEEFEVGMFDIFNEKAIFVHGHLDSVKTMVSDLTMMTKVFPIAVFTGHLHRNYEDEFNEIDLIMNPSGIGIGEYGKNLRKTSKPRQKLTIYEDFDGKVERMATFFINL